MLMDKYQKDNMIGQSTATVKHLLERWPFLFAAAKLLRKCNDKEYIRKVIKVGIDPDAIYVEQYGNEHKDKNVFRIFINGRTMGMAGFLRFTVYGLFGAEQLGFIPVVVYDEDNPYKEDDKFMGTNNSYEYYFHQPDTLNAEDVLHCAHVFQFNYIVHSQRIEQELGFDNIEPAAGYDIPKSAILKLGSVISRKMKLRTEVETLIQQGVDEMNIERKKTLAVHIRGTDFRKHWENHPNALFPEDYFPVIDCALQSGFMQIFLATDDSGYLEEFVKRYGEKVKYYLDVHRGSEETNISLVETHKKQEKYRNGLEVIRDMYTMAHCAGLIAGLSQVSIFARMVHASMGCEFELEEIISKGIYRKTW